MVAPCDKGLRFRVRLTPKSSRNAVHGAAVDTDGQAVLKVGVTAVPEGGKANAALVALLAKEWKLPKGAFTITSGTASRNKTLLISGDPDTLMSSLSGKIPS